MKIHVIVNQTNLQLKTTKTPVKLIEKRDFYYFRTEKFSVSFFTIWITAPKLRSNGRKRNRSLPTVRLSTNSFLLLHRLMLSNCGRIIQLSKSHLWWKWSCSRGRLGWNWLLLVRVAKKEPGVRRQSDFNLSINSFAWWILQLLNRNFFFNFEKKEI